MSDRKPFLETAPLHWNYGGIVLPIKKGTKRPDLSEFKSYLYSQPKPATRTHWLETKGDDGVALGMGREVAPGRIEGAYDIDDGDYVAFFEKLYGPFVCAKKAKKGLTFFFTTDADAPTRHLKFDGKTVVDILLRGAITLIPPTVHPEGMNYEWLGKARHEIEADDLIYIPNVEIDVVEAVLANPHHKIIMGGVSTHEAGLSLMASLAGPFNDCEMVCRIVEAFLPDGYEGNLRDELSGMFDSAKEKGLGKSQGTEYEYDAGSEGPIPMGYTANGNYVLMRQQTRTLTVLNPQTFRSLATLYHFTNGKFWFEVFPRLDKKGKPVGIDVDAAVDTLMQKCREAGPFETERVRGLGVYREGGQTVTNLRGPIPVSPDHTYIRFLSLPPFNETNKVDALKFLTWLENFPWEKPEYAILALGWAAFAPVCGALDWRPHIFINGPKNSGKTTIVRALARILAPMVIVFDGTSTEAGIRQKLDADSRPVVLDEFEADRDAARMQKIVKMTRSASSAEGLVARGTPEGKALVFSLRSTFCLGGINPINGTSADSSRIISLPLSKHKNDVAVHQRIQEGLAYFYETRGAWSHQMLELVDVMVDNIALFEKRMPPGDSRHNTNVATLLGAAFTTLNGRYASIDDAVSWIEKFDGVITKLAEAHEEDDSEDCLNHLLCYSDREITIGEMIQDARAQGITGDYPGLRRFGVKIRADGFLVANKHPALEEAFEDTIWSGGKWRSSLPRLPGAKNNDETRARFSGGHQSRCTLIPYDLLDSELPDPDNLIPA